MQSSSSMKRGGLAILLLVGIFTLVIAQPHSQAAARIIDFEGFTDGTVHNQEGWSSLGTTSAGCVVYDHQIVTNSYGYTSFGTKAFRISNAVTSGCFTDQSFSSSLSDDAGESSAENGGLSGGTRQSMFEAQWDFASTVPNAEQANLAVTASPDRGDGARMSWIQMADKPNGLQVNFNDYQRQLDPACTDTGTGAFVQTTVVSGLDRTKAHTIKIRMFFVDGPANDIVQVYVDGVLKHTGTSWEDYFRDCEDNPTRTVDSILFRTGGTAAADTAGKGFLIDNLILGSQASDLCSTECYVDAVNGNDTNGGNSATNAKKTIQAAINQLSPGGIVRVAAGSYPESPNITKALRLVGTAGRDATTIVLQKTPTYLGSLTIAASNVVIDGFTITGFDAVNTAPASTNIWITAGVDYIYILNNRILVGAINDNSQGDDGIGILSSWDLAGMVDRLMVNNNLFAPAASAGTRVFYINPGMDQFIFSKNTITGTFQSSAITQAKNGLIDSNVLTGTGTSTNRSAGFGTWGYPDAAVWGHTTFRDNSISGVANAILLYESDGITINNNSFNNNDYGINIRERQANAAPFTNISITENSFVGNSKAAVANERASGTAQALHNWWGHVAGPSTSTKTAGDMLVGAVGYDPWLCSGQDRSEVPGFQPDPQTSPCQAQIGTLQITSYDDLNQSGGQDADEPMLSGWTINVKQGSSQITSGNTAVNGLVSFSLAVGSYTVCEAIEAHWINTDPGDGSGCKTVTISADSTAKLVFGNHLPVEVEPEKALYLPLVLRP